MNEADLMRVMVSLNLADIMTATRPATPQQAYETPNNETAPTDPNQEFPLPVNSEQIKNTSESIKGSGLGRKCLP
jgi:hypothetical protein